MKSYTEYLWFCTEKKKEFINITEKTEEIVRKSGIKEGLVFIGAMHITAGVFVNDEEEGIKEDLLEWAERIAPFSSYKHHRTGETNGDAHLKSILFGNHVILPVTKGKLDLGPWQEIFYAEFDGCRKKRVVIKVIGQ